MSSPDPAEHRGVAPERTTLAWQRLALAQATFAGVLLAAAAHREAPWLLAPAVVAAALALRTWRAASQPVRGMRRDPAALRQLRDVTLAAAALATLVVLL
jgi:4-hydroxybenzoate polyprenyltransferase